MRRFCLFFAFGITASLVLNQLSTLTVLPVSVSYEEYVPTATTRGLGRKSNPRNASTDVFVEAYTAYCNMYPDLRTAFCGGKNSTCSTRKQATRCKEHWELNGRKEGREQLQSMVAAQKMEQLSELQRLRRAAKKTRKAETAAICIIVKNEEAYIDEFVDYHHALGFDMFYIYDNSVDFELRQWGSQKGPFVNVIHFPGDHAPQSRSYLNCAQHAYQAGHTWAAFFDADEYLVLTKHKTIVSFLREFCASGAIGINWIRMGTSEQLVFSPQPITKRFRYRESDFPNHHIKTIVRLEHMELTLAPANPHWVFLLEGYKSKTTDGRETDGPYQESGPTDVARLYHYQYKSFKEYVKKRERGRADMPQDSPVVQELVLEAQSKDFQNATIYDDTVWKAMKKLVPRYKAYEKLFSFPIFK